MHPDGTNPIRLTNAPGHEGDASFSPNGRSILFDSDRTGQIEIFSGRFLASNEIPVLDDEVTRLTNAPGVDSGPDEQPVNIDLAVHFEGPMRPEATTIRERTFVLSATNNGPTPAGGIDYSLKMDTGRHAVLSGLRDPSKGKCDARHFGRPRRRRFVVNCTAGPLAPGETVKVEIGFVFGLQGDYPWQALVDQDTPPDYRPENNREEGSVAAHD
jgi:hypothetical protein